MQTISTVPMLRSAIATLREGGKTIALVPTMGALHPGHMALIRVACDHADHVVASIFVNPRQFGPKEDFSAYPRQLARDKALLEAEDVALLWAPEPGTMYPPDYSTTVSVAGVSAGLCGADRPGHFDGVAMVVLKLFNQIQPDMAFFGEKDWQQLAVIRRMARDLDLAYPAVAAIHGVPTVREPDGLAMSSRNAYLSPEQRLAAALLPHAMEDAIAALARGSDPAAALEALRHRLLAGGFDRIDYAELRHGDTLEPAEKTNKDTRLFVAAWIGGTRLIDNRPTANGSGNPIGPTRN